MTQRTKQISIDDLVVGMYIVGLDQPWLQSPFLLHRRRIGHDGEIARLKTYGVRRVTIDPTRGLDLVETLPRPAEVKGGGEREQHNVHPPACGRPLVSPLPALALARAVHTEATTAVRSLFEGTQTGAALNSATAQEVVHHLMETVLSQTEAFAGIDSYATV